MISSSRRWFYRGWSLDKFFRTGPPANVVSTLFTVAGASRRPDTHVNPAEALELFGPGYPGGEILNRTAVAVAPGGRQGGGRHYFVRR